MEHDDNDFGVICMVEWNTVDYGIVHKVVLSYIAVMILVNY